MSKLKELVEALNVARKEFSDGAKAQIKAEAKEFFDKNPEIKAIVWTQYAPYFNDGEACEFGVNEMYVTTTDPDSEDFCTRDVAWGDDDGIVWEHDAANEFTSTLAAIPEDVMRSIFGDDALVMITPDGIVVEEYDHD